MSELNLRASIRILGLKGDKKTKADLVRDTEVGDIISIVMTLVHTTNRMGDLECHLNCLNRRTDGLVVKKQVDVMNILEKYFIFEQGEFHVS